MTDRRAALARAVVVGALAAALASRWPSDRWPLLALLAYVPGPVVALAALGALVVLRRQRARRAWAGAGAAALALGLTGTARDNARLVAPRARQGEGLVVVHWNVGRSAGAAHVLSALAPDVLCVSEPPREVVYAVDPARGAWVEGPLLVSARFEVERRRVERREGLRALHAVVRCAPPLSLLLVDVQANPLMHRARPFAALRELLPALDPPPDLVLGDLNTPAGAFTVGRALGPDFVDAYDLAGRGPGFTWPSYLPLLRIDHVHARRGLDVLRYETGFGWRSDHRWQRLVLAPRR